MGIIYVAFQHQLYGVGDRGRSGNANWTVASANANNRLDWTFRYGTWSITHGGRARGRMNVDGEE